MKHVVKSKTSADDEGFDEDSCSKTYGDCHDYSDAEDLNLDISIIGSHSLNSPIHRAQRYWSFARCFARLSFILEIPHIRSMCFIPCLS
jgi:hypothetical protein